MSHFPIRRLRRLRRTPALRRLVQETQLAPAQLVWPLFVCHGEGVRREVPALPGVYQTSVDELVQDAERARRLGLGGIILFGLPETKDATGSEAYDGPFREAAGAPPQFGDRQSYQMQGTNPDEAMKEIELDVDEGADIIMVKPALPCLDLIGRAKQRFGSPLAAFQVSGEYAMIKAAAERGMLDEQRAMWETLYAIRRAGADIILSYFAPCVAELL